MKAAISVGSNPEFSSDVSAVGNQIVSIMRTAADVHTSEDVTKHALSMLAKASSVSVDHVAITNCCFTNAERTEAE